MNESNRNKWDIFCKIIDNFGDIGVCWRLAKQLNHEYALDVRLWVDDLSVASKIVTGLDTDLNSQKINGIEICLWGEHTNFENIRPASVVIEAFGCELPTTYIQNMITNKPIWLNLEYLSAETWVDDFHGKVSINADTGLQKTFFFPGFTNKTGGLIREQDLITKREAAKKQIKNLPSLQVSLFCYPHAPICTLLESMAEGERAVNCFVPTGSHLEKIADFFGCDQVQVGETFKKQQLSLTVLHFLTQSEYDNLLWRCDLNFVRGEDSWIRALWSNKPFIWQPYPQEEKLHLKKLDAFLEKYDIKQSDILYKLHHAWLDREITCEIWNKLLKELPIIKEHAVLQTHKFEKQADLAANLVIFTKNKV